MADVITRFKLETTQYDSKLRDASKSLAAYSKQAELAGKDFDKFTKGGVDAAKSLGNIATSATNTKDKVKELVSAYNDLAKAYNALTEEQKKSDFGKAMAQSLQQLQGRIRDAKAEMNSTGGELDKLKERFTVNIDAIKLFNVGLSAAKAALDVAKDAIFNNEEQLDTWGRVVESSQSLYEGFLNALNTGDISGYLNNISSITRAAQNAYDALDALSTFNAFNQVNVEKTRTGMTESIVDFREGNGSKEAVKAAGDAYKKELVERKKLEKEAYLAKVKEVAAQRGVSGDDLIMALSGSYGSYQSLKALPMSGSRIVNYGGGMFGGGGSYEEAIPANRQEKLGAALRKLNDTELQSLQALGAQAERTSNEIASVDRQLTRVLNGRQPGVRVPSSSGKGFNADSIAFKAMDGVKADPDKYFNSVWAEIGEAGRKAIAETADKQWDLGKDISTDWVVNSKGQLVNKKQGKGKDSESNFVKGIDNVNDTLSNVGGSINNIFSSLQQMGIEIPQGIASVLGALNIITSILTFIQSVVAIKSILPFAGGGLVPHAAGGYMVPGNYYSGDVTPIMANAGELILNKSQQNNIASQLTQAGGGGRLVAKLKGRDILISLERELSETGKGQLATWR